MRGDGLALTQLGVDCGEGLDTSSHEGSGPDFTWWSIIHAEALDTFRFVRADLDWTRGSHNRGGGLDTSSIVGNGPDLRKRRRGLDTSSVEGSGPNFTWWSIIHAEGLDTFRFLRADLNQDT